MNYVDLHKMQLVTQIVIQYGLSLDVQCAQDFSIMTEAALSCHPTSRLFAFRSFKGVLLLIMSQ